MSETLSAYKGRSRHTKETQVAKVSSSFLTKLQVAIDRNIQTGFDELATKKACWGIKDSSDDLPMIMGVLDFGDPGHTVPNTKKGSPTRKRLADAVAAFGGENSSAIPPRPWLSGSTKGEYRTNIKRYVRTQLPRMIAGITKAEKGRYASKSSRKALSVDDFVKGLAEVGAKNAKDYWENGPFIHNAPMTLENKSDPRPLHGRGTMNESKIEGWVE